MPFLASIALLVLLVPYALLMGTLAAAQASGASRANIRKDIAIVLVAALISAPFADRNIFMEEAVLSIQYLATEPFVQETAFAGMLTVIFLGLQFLKIAAAGENQGTHFFKTAALTLVFASPLYGALLGRPLQVNGFDSGPVVIAAFGALSLVFFAGIHSVFSKIVLVMNLGGVAINVLTGQPFSALDYYIILDLLPDFDGAIGIVIVIASTAIAAYNLAVERGWISPVSLSIN